MKYAMNILDIPLGYLAFQWLVGGIRARARCTREHMRPGKGMRVLDLGCGPGYVAKWLAGSEYVGLDTDQKYINYAQRHYGKYGEFQCNALSDDFLNGTPGFDYVLMHGVLHHLSDTEACEVLRLCHKGLKKGGILVTLDGYYSDKHHAIARLLLNLDRGTFVRTKSAYIALVRTVFSSIKYYEHPDYFRVPYSALVMECQRQN
jgi:2-polyprenyl-3-methyl-5-hydroxy-6-metoxy-1,4-benzoquinol methylase